MASQLGGATLASSAANSAPGRSMSNTRRKRSAGVLAWMWLCRSAVTCGRMRTPVAGSSVQYGRRAMRSDVKCGTRMGSMMAGMVYPLGVSVKSHGARGSQVTFEERHRPSQDGSPVWALRLLRGAKRAAIIAPWRRSATMRPPLLLGLGLALALLPAPFLGRQHEPRDLHLEIPLAGWSGPCDLDSPSRQPLHIGQRHRLHHLRCSRPSGLDHAGHSRGHAVDVLRLLPERLAALVACLHLAQLLE